MECFQARRRFLYKFKDNFDFVLLTANTSVPDALIKETPDLPWNLGAHGERLSVPDGYLDKLREHHTESDMNEWNYIESMANPHWTWDTMLPTVEKAMTNPQWQERFGRWFFQNWSRNKALMRTSELMIIDSLAKYIASTKIKRSLKRCITDPTHMFCRARLLREFSSMNDHIVCT